LRLTYHDVPAVYQQALAEAAGFAYRVVGCGVSRRMANGASHRPRERGYEAGRGTRVTAA
jgi:hypothetical protein